ncbi:hypothetical protein [Tamlana sp. I1]|uniref:hypothetical protein n=1 Tax=Tamlana sp. I1 TaxID=2762061 RepID=UPI00188EC8D4|nr:hypothetical protein [Tamlana sp. I1]
MIPFEKNTKVIIDFTWIVYTPSREYQIMNFRVIPKSRNFFTRSLKYSWLR